MTDDLRGRIAQALCPPHHRVGSFVSGQPVTALSPCQLHQAQADTVLTVVQPELDSDLTTLCPHCICADCGGRNAEHEPGRLCGCGCEPACDLFLFDSELAVIDRALEPLVGSPMAEALAHVVWHALHPTHPTTKESLS